MLACFHHGIAMKPISFIVNTFLFFPLFVNFVVSDNLATNLQNLRNFKGPLVSVSTPFTIDTEQNLNLSLIPDYAEFLKLKNISGVLIAGPLGEGTSLTVEERKKLAEAWAEVVKITNQHLMIQVGGTALKSVKELAAHAESIGVDSLLVLPDLYVKPNTVDDLIDYLKLISEAAPNTPLLYYQSSEFGLNIDVRVLLKTVGKKVPTFAGIKHITKDSDELMKTWLAGNQYKLLIGTDESSLVGCIIGMDSSIPITTIIAPELYFKVLDNCHNVSTFRAAVEAQDSINKIVKEIFSYDDYITAMKAATTMITRIPVGSPRPPLKALSSKQLQSLRKNLALLGVDV